DRPAGGRRAGRPGGLPPRAHPRGRGAVRGEGGLAGAVLDGLLRLPRDPLRPDPPGRPHDARGAVRAPAVAGRRAVRGPGPGRRLIGDTRWPGPRISSWPATSTPWTRPGGGPERWP